MSILIPPSLVIYSYKSIRKTGNPIGREVSTFSNRSQPYISALRLQLHLDPFTASIIYALTDDHPQGLSMLIFSQSNCPHVTLLSSDKLLFSENIRQRRQCSEIVVLETLANELEIHHMIHHQIPKQALKSLQQDLLPLYPVPMIHHRMTHNNRQPIPRKPSFHHQIKEGTARNPILKA